MDMSINTASLAITPQMLSLIAENDEFKGAWRALGTLAPDRLSALRRVATIESIGSSTRIEGSKLSDSDVERLLANLEIQTFETRDEQEVAGYAEVMESVFASYDAIPLTQNHIKQLHRDLLMHSSKDTRHRGAYKTNTNHVVALDADGKEIGTVFETATPFNTPRLMEELVAWVNETLDQKQLHPLLATAIFIVVFLEIHPFQDGNGRLSRVLTTLLLLHCGYAYVPYSSLESVIESTKDGYYLCLRRTQGTIRSDAPAWEPWIIYFLTSLQRQKARLEAKIERENLLIVKLPELSVQILELAKAHGRITVSQIVSMSGANRNTVKKHLQALASANHLAQHGSGKGTWYGRV
ncbi:Fic family protein [Novosphingopyxis sp.]|uniref:Fic family protein n=1 Tax=Novosphingopyxis sp. TaxID=2709690 RepID=UPI003B590339